MPGASSSLFRFRSDECFYFFGSILVVTEFKFIYSVWVCPCDYAHKMVSHRRVRGPKKNQRVGGTTAGGGPTDRQGLDRTEPAGTRRSQHPDDRPSKGNEAEAYDNWYVRMSDNIIGAMISNNMITGML